MKKNFLFKGISVLGATLLFATSVMPGLQYTFAEPSVDTPVIVYDYIHDAESWNNAYHKDNSKLKEYLDEEWGEDRWSITNGVRCGIEYWNSSSDGFVDDANCVPSWHGAVYNNVNAPYNAFYNYPWLILNFSAPANGVIKVTNGTNTKFRGANGWKDTQEAAGDRDFSSYSIISIPTQLLSSYAITDDAGTTSFNTGNLEVQLILSDSTVVNVSEETYTPCEDGKHRESGQGCVANTKAAESCTPTSPVEHGKTYETIPTWTPEYNTYINGECTVATCDEGYNAENGKCVQKPVSYSGGGGGGGSSKASTKNDTKATDTDKKADETKAEETKDDEKVAEEAKDQQSSEEKVPPMTDAQAVAKFGQEQIDAYKWAYENGITTMNNVKDARLDQPLTRAELAKMMVVYVAKVLGKQPVLTGNVDYQDVKESELGDLAGYIKLAYQYQIMGINADGTPIDFFNPFGVVSRGEYATVFSRVLFGALFNKEGEDFYTNHLKALEAAGILSNTEPTIQEMRGWVMLMMYRSSQNAEKIAEVAAELGATE